MRIIKTHEEWEKNLEKIGGILLQNHLYQRKKKRENYGHCKVLDGLQYLSCIPEINSHSCQCGQRDHLKTIKYYHSNI